MGHDEKEYKAYLFLQENIVDTYLMKNDKQMQVESSHMQFPQPKGAANFRGRGKGGGFNRERGQIIF